MQDSSTKLESLEEVLDSIYDPISIVDKNGYLIFANKACEKNPCGIPVAEMIGKHMNELVEMGMMDYSLSLECINSKVTHGICRLVSDKYGASNRLNWVSPHFDENGELDYVVNTEWPLKHWEMMHDFYMCAESLKEKEINELNYFRSKNTSCEEIVFQSDRMKDILSIVNRIALSDACVLIRGESGTGKGVIARRIVANSPRAHGPLIEINCGAVPENLIESELFGYEPGAFTGASDKGKKGLFELADKGTLFLDEIAELPYHLQAKLLRAVQEKEIIRIGGTKPIPVDIRIIAATNSDLELAVKNKTFRSDLYFRLNVVPIIIPPLRERKEDIIALYNYFSNYYGGKYKKNIRLSDAAVRMLSAYEWPGNVRELQNFVERLYIIEPESEISSEILSSYLYHTNRNNHPDYTIPIDIDGGSFDLEDALDTYEKNILQSNIDRYSSLRQYAEFLGISKSALERKLKKYGITKN